MPPIHQTARVVHPGATACDRGDIAQAIERLANEIDVLQKVVDSVSQKFEPVLVILPEPPNGHQTAGAPLPPEPIRSALGNTILSLARRVDSAASQLESLRLRAQL